MHALFVTALPPERSSFVGRLLPLARALQSAGHATSILTLSGARMPPYQHAEDRGGVEIRAVGPNLRATETPAPTPPDTWSRLRAGRAALTQALAETAADVVILAKPQVQNTPPTLAFARARGVPLVLEVDDLEAEASRLPALARFYARMLERSAAHRAALITACSPFLVEHYRRLHPRARVEFLPTGISVPARVPPARLRERLGLPPEAKVILYLGSLSIASGHRVDLLIDAYAQLITRNSEHPVDLVLAGDGLDAGWLRGMARRSLAAERIHFLGRFEPPEDIALAREADLLADPVDATPTNEAKSSHRVLLALATGTPVVAGGVGIRALLLPPALREACLYHPSAPGALTAALRRGLDPALRREFREQTAGRIDQWTWETLGKRFVSLLEFLARVR